MPWKALNPGRIKNVIAYWTEEWACELVSYFYFSCCGLDLKRFEQGGAALGYLGANKVLVCTSVYEKL